MSRCLVSQAGFARRLFLLWVLCLIGAGAHAQLSRNLPLNSLRGSITFDSSTQVTLNGEDARLAPGARIRGQNNMLVLSAGLIGQSYQVNYILDFQGLVKDVWLLRDDEAAALWPSTPKEAATWHYDGVQRVWVKP